MGHNIRVINGFAAVRHLLVGNIVVLPRFSKGWSPYVPKLIDHDKRRSEIIGAAWDLIGADGVYGATVRHVASRAQVDPGSLRYIFRTQGDLLLAAASDLCARLTADVAGRSDDYSRPEQAMYRLAAALPSSSEHQLQWRVERAFRFGLNQFPALTPVVGACRTARLVEVRNAVSEMAFGLGVSEPTLDFEVHRTHALSEGLGELLSDDAMLRADARQTLLTHLQGAQDNWRLSRAAKVREAERMEAARVRAS